MSQHPYLQHFKLREFACPCCGQASMHPTFLMRLDMLRDELGFPLVITSGYRCPNRNVQASTTGLHGPHTTGRAADIAIHGGRAFQLIEQAITRGFRGVGVHQRGPSQGRFVHLDDLENLAQSPRPRIWSY